ncbi:MAG: hypothetical protein PHX74_10960, partial [Candidatus Sumerlaeales bacterium]|nr:hypothetical protein [Candidatus Sumerlaeales bacterium]
GRMNRLTFTKEFKKHEEIGHILCLKPEKLIEWEEKLSQYEDIGEPKELIKRPSLDENGLAQCGCGGNARIKHDGSYSSKCIVENAGGTVRYESATVEYPGHTHAWVECDNDKCRCSVGYSGGLIFQTDDEARDAWNTAMSGGTYEQG